jgi:uncharacterized protein DUF3303
MLFLTYWELNENMAESERLQVAQKLLDKGLFPPKGVNVLRWDGTPDGWGILLLEADSAEDAFRAIDVWRAAGAGFFKSTRTAPALSVQQMIQLTSETTAALGKS